ncbi:aldose epimerase family protein [Oceanispirochaeta sp.]|uniref:aldose epimerase family protein n=1 Tax=Oceanispirochaeta sp. TaxID=2035350 RepID=UPI00261370A1|nr:aldose epimerase family protein [Oceanispirochaeta sp.]MDA3957813.1 galactose mutarotase [Oceanispirochaeta sp.]
MKISKKVFGTLPDGNIADLYTLEGNNGLSVQITSFGGVITSIKCPDRQGKIEEITLGFDSLKEYTDTRFFFGAAIGRFGNRIANGRFTLEGQEYKLPQNNGTNCLHGGVENAFDRKNWLISPFEKKDAVGVILNAFSPDGEEGFPGNLSTTMTYTLTSGGELILDYKAVTDKATPVNLTNHSYFNLGGIHKATILDHRVQLDCPFYLPVDEKQIPTGEILSVKGTVMDFTEEETIGTRINQVDGGGYDHCYVLAPGRGIRKYGTVHDPVSGRSMDVFTDQPGVQFYTGNFLKDAKGRGGQIYGKNWGFCLETQLYPDCVNQTQFPSCILKPGELYTHTSSYQFSVN